MLKYSVFLYMCLIVTLQLHAIATSDELDDSSEEMQTRHYERIYGKYINALKFVLAKAQENEVDTNREMGVRFAKMLLKKMDELRKMSNAQKLDYWHPRQGR